MVLEKLIDYEDNFLTYFDEPKLLSKIGTDGESALGRIVQKIEQDKDKDVDNLSIASKDIE